MIPALFAAFWALYTFTLPHQYTYDGLCYALDAERAPVANIFHPGHLLYSAVARLLWNAASVAGYHGPAIYFMQAVNAMVAAAAVALLALLLQRRASNVKAFVGAMIFGLSHALWSEAADPGCYAWAALASVALLWLLVEGVSTHPFFVGLSHGLLVLWHQMLILVAPAFVWRLVYSSSPRIVSGDPSTAFRDVNRPPPTIRGGDECFQYVGVMSYISGLFLTVVIPYAIVASLFHGESVHEAFYWALGPAGPPPGTPIFSSYWWSVDLWRNVKTFVSALGTAFIIPVGIWQTAGIGIAFALVVRAALGGRHIPLWIWLGSLSLFQFFFAPGATRFRILLFPSLIYLALIAPSPLQFWKKQYRPNEKTQWIFAGLFAAIIFLANFTESIRPAMRPPSYHAPMAWVRQTVGPNDFLLYRGRGAESILNVYLVYFAPQVPARSLSGYLFSTPSGRWEEMDETLAVVRARGGRIFIEGSLLDAAVQRAIEEDANLSAGHLAQWLGKFKQKAVFEGPDGYKLFQAK